MKNSDLPQKLPDLAQRLKEIHHLATVGQCINGVIHDTNNYLGAIMAYAELLLVDPTLNKDNQRLLRKIIDSVQSCAELINELHTITRIKEPSILLIDITKLLNKVLTLRKYYHKILKINVKKEIDAKTQSITVDFPKIQFALLQLIKNAEDNLEQKEVDETNPRLIKITCKEKNEGIAIEIYDNGPSIPEDSKQVLFTPFSTTKLSHHLGLGLAIAREIIEEHKGTLEYNEKAGFCIWIPLENPKKSLLFPEGYPTSDSQDT